MSLHQTIKSRIPEAMKAKDVVVLRTIRSLVTAMTNEVVAKKRKPDEFLTDDEALAVIKRAANQRKDSIEQFLHGGRAELAEPEKAELAVLETFLPAQMSAEEIEVVVKEKIAALGSIDKSKMGMVMGTIMKELGGSADGALVKAAIEKQLV